MAELVDNLTEKHDHPRSAVVIARLLHADTFSDDLAVKVWDYFLHTSILPKQRRAHRRHRENLRHIAAGLGKKEKRALGKFIASIARAHFDTGLRIGLTALAYKNEQPQEVT